MTVEPSKLDPDLLAILACPTCKKPVQPTKDGCGLICEGCDKVYPVRENIPVMLEDEAISVADWKGCDSVEPFEG